MTIRNDRSMNSDLARGAVEGKMRFLRPNADSMADEVHAQERAVDLHEQHYGTMGVSQHDLGTVQANVPTQTSPYYPPYLGEGATDYGM
jgi:hypothetical protein